MQTHRSSDSTPLCSSSAAWWRGLLAIVALGVASCGPSSPSGASEAAADDAALEKDDVTTGSPAPVAAPVNRAPAQVSEAAKALDLSRVPLLANAENPAERLVTSLIYAAPGSPEDAFKFHRDQLTGSAWKELPGSSVTPQYASGVFAKDGLHISLVAHPQAAGKVGVAVQHHGNVNFGKLPVPSGAKAIYAGPSSAIFAVEAPVETTAQATAAALAQAGWVPYGGAGNVQWFKQNAVKLSAMIAAAPAQGGKTTINFTSEMLPVDVPLPPSAIDVQFSNARKRLTFQVELTQEACFAFLLEALAKTGWQATMEAPAKSGPEHFIVLQNAAKDILRIGVQSAKEAQLSVTAEFLPITEIEEMNRKLDAQRDAAKAAKAAAASATGQGQ